MGDVVDYSWARPSPAELAATGNIGVMRYLSHEAGKNLSSGELSALHDGGLGVGVVWETTADRANGGYPAGQQDAVAANAQADSLGLPHELPLFYAVDFDPGHNMGPITDYFRGVLEACCLRPAGVYGTYSVLESVAGVVCSSMKVMCFWQTAGWSGSGSGSGGSFKCADGSTRRLSKHACMFQDVGGGPVPGTDRNAVLEPSLHWLWLPGGSFAPNDMWEALMGEAVGADGLDGLWEICFDGYGRRRRCHIESPAMQGALAKAGDLRANADGTPAPSVHLTGDQANAFISIPPSNPDWTDDWGAVYLSQQILNYVGQCTTSMLTAIGASTGAPPVSMAHDPDVPGGYGMTYTMPAGPPIIDSEPDDPAHPDADEDDCAEPELPDAADEDDDDVVLGEPIERVHFHDDPN